MCQLWRDADGMCLPGQGALVVSPLLSPCLSMNATTRRLGWTPGWVVVTNTWLRALPVVRHRQALHQEAAAEVTFDARFYPGQQAPEAVALTARDLDIA